LTADLDDLLRQTDVLKAGAETATQSIPDGVLISDSVSEDIARLFLHAVAVAMGSLFETRFNILFEIPDNQLRHRLP
jgi:hypothetical protein